jgi:hypothetical protein
MQHSWSVAGEQLADAEHALGFDEQHALAPHVVPPQTMPPAPLHVGVASTWQTPGDVGSADRWQWKPGWQLPWTPSALQQSCWSGAPHIVAAEQA